MWQKYSFESYSYGHWFSNFSIYHIHLEDFNTEIDRPHPLEFLIQEDLVRTQEFVFQAVAEVMLMVLVWEPHFENHLFGKMGLQKNIGTYLGLSTHNFAVRLLRPCALNNKLTFQLLCYNARHLVLYMIFLKILRFLFQMKGIYSSFN